MSRSEMFTDREYTSLESRMHQARGIACPVTKDELATILLKLNGLKVFAIDEFGPYRITKTAVVACDGAGIVGRTLFEGLTGWVCDGTENLACLVDQLRMADTAEEVVAALHAEGICVITN